MHTVAPGSGFLAAFCLDCLHVSQPRCAVDSLSTAEDKWGTLSVARSGPFPRYIASWLPWTLTLCADAKAHLWWLFRRDKSQNSIGQELHKWVGDISWTRVKNDTQWGQSHAKTVTGGKVLKSGLLGLGKVDPLVDYAQHVLHLVGHAHNVSTFKIETGWSEIQGYF